MWATHLIEQLKRSEIVHFRPHGNSMQPRIESGQLVTLVAVNEFADFRVGDIVLCKVEGHVYLHLISAIGSDGRLQISNNKGHVNGWTTRKNVFGLVVAVNP